ncbi:hypothetical protein ACP1UU_004483 [Vibrio alginolyticus]|uniref:hypothetical protein n=1 Tax=Vibrio parahaemolyticus TaxID=670 RepID=UPI00111F1BEE|nr:hypothetical protein [Vibrio parahaemolyticus]HAS8438610.1 hypothetical protein [Vibrio vulnificus]EIA1590742.1 hypothetical protein [Vibrio parahaemolyticus]TOC10601.1 hypothetical protein CGJ91_23045 [Vibrio parahaemolyticus]TOF04252.1 hypothetical protein CGJ29_24730 [Vibrio parahaemolyticus]TOQ87534.1 hypothetical protein CGG85_22570 [Vibrio parahaemolyticus]
MSTPWVENAITSIDWNKIVSESMANKKQISVLESELEILQYWLRELINFHSKNRALPFLYEGHSSINDFSCAISLGLYKLSASSIRTILEAFLNFSYYKDHSVELTTLVKNNSFYLGKKDIIEYHKLHTLLFNERSEQLNTVDLLNKLYKEVSQIIHGQVPGKWNNCSKLDETSYQSEMLDATITMFSRLVKIINIFLISSLSDEEWNSLNVRSKSLFLKGLTSEKKLKLQRN